MPRDLGYHRWSEDLGCLLRRVNHVLYHVFTSYIADLHYIRRLCLPVTWRSPVPRLCPHHVAVSTALLTVLGSGGSQQWLSQFTITLIRFALFMFSTLADNGTALLRLELDTPRLLRHCPRSLFPELQFVVLLAPGSPSTSVIVAFPPCSARTRPIDSLPVPP